MTHLQRVQEYLSRAKEAEEQLAKTSDAIARSAWQTIADSYRALARRQGFLDWRADQRGRKAITSAGSPFRGRHCTANVKCVIRPCHSARLLARPAITSCMAS